MAVSWAWAGAVTDTAATIATKVTAGASCRAKVSTSSDLSSPAFSAAVAPDAYGYLKLSLTGLVANTQYHYGIEVDGVVDAFRGRFETMPVPLAASNFTVAFGSCWIAAEDHRPAVTIKARHPKMFIQYGDFGYFELVSTNDEADWRAGYEAIIGTVNIAELLGDVANAYIWDDHDYGLNNTDSTYFGRPAASSAYRRVVPHYPLPASGDAPIYQAFSIGRVRFIMTDHRHARDTSTVETQTPSSSMLGASQKAWFKQQLLDAKTAGYGLIVWVNSQVFIATEDYLPDGYAIDDSWAEFTAERAELVDYMKANGIDNVCIIAGDMHALAIDSGAHADYATGGGHPIPVFQAAPLGRIGGNLKGGPYDYAPFISSQNSHYGVMDITDDGGTVVVTWTAWTVIDATGVESIKYQHRFRRPITNRGTIRNASGARLGGRLKSLA